MMLMRVMSLSSMCSVYIVYFCQFDDSVKVILLKNVSVIIFFFLRRRRNSFSFFVLSSDVGSSDLMQMNYRFR